MSVGGTTRTDIGIVWGWRTLSPRWRGVWDGGIAGMPLDYDVPKMDKAMIIMTDGQNVLYPGDTPNSVAATYAQLSDECEAMKDEGIIIYTITFQTPNWIKPYFEDCASRPDNFIDSPTNGDLVAAFRRIGQELSNLRIAE